MRQACLRPAIRQLRRHAEANILGDAGQHLELDLVELAQPVDQLLHQLVRRRGAGGDADRLGALDPARVERVGIGDEIARHALLGGDLAQAVGVRAVGGADHQHDVDHHGQLARRALAVLRRVADVLGVRTDDRRESARSSASITARVSSTLSVVWVM